MGKSCCSSCAKGQSCESKKSCCSSKLCDPCNDNCGCPTQKCGSNKCCDVFTRPCYPCRPNFSKNDCCKPKQCEECCFNVTNRNQHPVTGPLRAAHPNHYGQEATDPRPCITSVGHPNLPSPPTKCKQPAHGCNNCVLFA